MELSDKSQLIEYLKDHDLWAKKGLSQNFLVDKNALERIVEAADLQKDDMVIEIGPGLGTLTSELVKRAGQVVAVEMDDKLADLLTKKEVANLKIVNSDILKINLSELLQDCSYKVIANIPYHITSKILELFLSREHKPELMVLLVQKEVAERVCAKPGDMSVLSVSVQLFGEPEIIDIVPKESFFPSPKVDSAILKIASIRHSEASIQEEKSFFRLVHIGFAARRKTLLNNLMNGYQLDRQKVTDIIRSIGLKETVRAQELSIENWKKLLSAIDKN